MLQGPGAIPNGVPVSQCEGLRMMGVLRLQVVLDITWATLQCSEASRTSS